MIRLMVVDDDEIICTGIATCIDWQAHDVLVAGTAYDGELGLEMARELSPDVMLVDINMPFMDGLELAYAVRQLDPHVKIILLTAYKEFEYARRAIDLQVYSYIAKPFRNEEVLEAVLAAGRVVLAERSYRRELEEHKEMILQKYLLQIATGRTGSLEKMRWCSLDPENELYAVGILALAHAQPEGEGAGPGDGLMTVEVSQRLFADEVARIISAQQDIRLITEGEWMVLLFAGRSDGQVRAAAEDILRGLVRYYGFHVALCVGRCYNGAKQIACSYEEARRAQEYRAYFGGNSVIHIEDMENRRGEGALIFPPYRRRILELMREGDVNGAREAAEQLFGRIEAAGRYTVPAVAFLAAELLMACCKATGDEELYGRFMQEGAADFCGLQSAGSIGDIRRLVNRGLGLFDWQGDERSELERLLERVTAYIGENYADPDLSLKTAAAHVHISAGYLCILFRQFMQTSYVAYVNSVRMEKAKQLLRKGNTKTYEVAFAVGYNSSQYFASSFKRYTGSTPSEFRSEQR